MNMRKAKRTFINTPKANRMVGGFDFSHMKQFAMAMRSS